MFRAPPIPDDAKDRAFFAGADGPAKYATSAMITPTTPSVMIPYRRLRMRMSNTADAAAVFTPGLDAASR